MAGALDNRAAIITGASQGLGRAIAELFVKEGANVLLCARDASKLAETTEELSQLAQPGRKVVAQPADVSREADGLALVRRALGEFTTIQILVNNAGVYGPMGAIDGIAWEEWRRAVEINLYGSILMCRSVLPHFKKNRYGKIVQLSGGGATSPLPYFSAYAVSKAGVVRFAETLAEEVREFGIDVNAIAPGALNTRLLDEVLEAGPASVGESFFARAEKQKQEGGAPLETGARLAAYLASAASDGITGKLISALWDPWQELQKHRTDLASTDIYTLRRIVPADRNLDW